MQPRRTRKGFTLIEAMVSLVVLAIGILAVWNVFSMASWASEQDANTRTALMLADTTLARLSVTPIKQLGRQAGRFEEPYQRYQWTCDAENSSLDGLAQVVVRVYWQQRGQQRSVTLATLLPT